MKKKILLVGMSTPLLFGLSDQMRMAQMEEKLLGQQKVNIIRQISEEQARDVKDNVEHKNPNEKRIQLLNELVAEFTKTHAQMPLSTVFKDYSQQNQLLLDKFDLIKQAVDILSTKNINQRTQHRALPDKPEGQIIEVALGELNEHSSLIQITLQSIFDAIDHIRLYIKKTIPSLPENFNKGDAQIRDNFKKLSKKTIDNFVNEMKSAQKKMKSKFGFFGGLLVGKPFLYKHAYEALKKVVAAIDTMIKTFEDQALKKELYELMKK